MKIARFSRVDLPVQADKVLREPDVAGNERLVRLRRLRAREPTHALDRVENLLILRRLVARQPHELGDVRTLIAHPLHATDDVQQRRDDPQVAGDRRLPSEQRQHALVYLQVAPVDPIIIGDNHPGQLDVLVADGLERPVELLDHHLKTPERLALELLERFAELVAGLQHRG